MRRGCLQYAILLPQSYCMHRVAIPFAALDVRTLWSSISHVTADQLYCPFVTSLLHTEPISHSGSISHSPPVLADPQAGGLSPERKHEVHVLTILVHLYDVPPGFRTWLSYRHGHSAVSLLPLPNLSSRLRRRKHPLEYCGRRVPPPPPPPPNCARLCRPHYL